MSYNINISKEITMEILNSIPTAKTQREATLNYEEAIKEDVMNLTKEVKYQIEKSARSGLFTATVIIEPNTIRAWSVDDIRYYMESVLKDLGYKVERSTYSPCKFTIRW